MNINKNSKKVMLWKSKITHNKYELHFSLVKI